MPYKDRERYLAYHREYRAKNYQPKPRVIACEKCGDWIIATSNRQKYCNACRKGVLRQWHRDHLQRQMKDPIFRARYRLGCAERASRARGDPQKRARVNEAQLRHTDMERLLKDPELLRRTALAQLVEQLFGSQVQQGEDT